MNYESIGQARMPAAMRCHADDTVIVALRDIAAGETVEAGGAAITANAAIRSGHKIALRNHAPGDPVIRYGERIGLASAPISAGDHVHSHNLKTALSGEVAYADFAGPENDTGAEPLGTWLGYRREDGRYATRNEIWLIPTVGCVAPMCEMLAREAEVRHGDAIEAGKIDGIVGLSLIHI